MSAEPRKDRLDEIRAAERWQRLSDLERRMAYERRVLRANPHYRAR